MHLLLLSRFSRVLTLCDSIDGSPPSAAAAAKSLQSCPTLCDSIDSSPPGSPVPGILQARTLEWVAISFSNAWKEKVKGKSLSRVRLFATPWTAAYQAPLSMGFSRQEYRSGVPLPSPTSPAALPKATQVLSWLIALLHIESEFGGYCSRFRYEQWIKKTPIWSWILSPL